MGTVKKIVGLCVVAALFVGCAFGGGEKKKPFKTLADLEQPLLKREDINPVPKVSLDELEETYRSTLEVVKDPDIRHRILLRLADLEMARGEKNQLQNINQESYFDQAIAFYNEMIERNKERQGLPGTPTNERLLYRLSKAHALDGDIESSNEVLERLVTEFPESPFLAEADFRRAEKAFNDGQYKEAEALYAKVMAVSKDTPFYRNAVYMHGWSRFKQARYRATIPSFTEVLDLTLPEGTTIDELSNSQRNLVDDTFRILSIVFSYEDGANTLFEVYNNLGVRHYQHILYQRLGDFYLEQGRFRDSADTYRFYVQNYPNTDYSPDFSVKAIKVYEQGNFPSLILPAKEEYVENYGIYSDFWKDRDETVHNKIKPNLNQFIDELASFYHARAFDLQSLNKEYVAQQQSPSSVPKEKRFKSKPDSPKPDFLKAASFYKQFMETFPDDKKTPELVYFMGEAYYEADYLPAAVEAYEIVAYRYLDDKRGAEAGFSAIVSMQRLVKITEGDRQLHWKGHKIDSSINFSNFYEGDSRAVGVLTAAAKELFDSGQLNRAIEQGLRVTQWNPAPPKSLLVTAWLIVAHSRFDLEQYAAAEISYRTLLPLLDDQAPEKPQVVERIAASIYKQAEQQLASEDKTGAIERLLSIREIAPGSDIAISAQYDAANYLIELKDWRRAELELLDFRKQFPNHKLIPTLPAKFAFIYQESEQWGKAADTVAQMAKTDGDPEIRRQSLYLSAELYEKAKDTEQAILQYRTYANNHRKPFALATEARFHLVELYGETKQEAKRDFWLKKLIEEHKKAGSDGTDRSRYLAAFATLKFANDDYARFGRAKLKLPLKKSLKVKKAAMDKALNGYKATIKYGIAEFATEANNKIGNLYARLSTDLMDSQRPKGLDELALEQYEILLEEQAFPFEEKAIDIHEANAQRAWKGLYDNWVKESFSDLAKLLPARYGKREITVEISDALY